jgi:photosystem II stability/assembly factor-like uncharacterized protein
LLCGGWNGKIIYTNDGGDNWRFRSKGLSLSITSVSFIDEYNGWALTGNNGIMKTTNGGDDWTLYPSGTNNWLFLYIFCFLKKLDMLPVHGTVIKTTDGGINWFDMPKIGERDDYGIKFFDEIRFDWYK